MIKPFIPRVVHGDMARLNHQLLTQSVDWKTETINRATGQEEVFWSLKLWISGSSTPNKTDCRLCRLQSMKCMTDHVHTHAGIFFNNADVRFRACTLLSSSSSSSAPRAPGYDSYQTTCTDAGNDTETHQYHHLTTLEPDGCSRNSSFFSRCHLPFFDRSKLRSSSQESVSAAAWPVRLLLLRDLASLPQSWWRGNTAQRSPNLPRASVWLPDEAFGDAVNWGKIGGVGQAAGCGCFSPRVEVLTLRTHSMKLGILRN